MLRVRIDRTQAPGPSAARDVATDDAGLIERVARQDRAAFELLYRSYFPRLARFLGRTVRRPQLVGEIVNDTLLVVWRKAGSFNGSSKVSTWIFAIAYRTAVKAIVRHRDPVEGGESMAPAGADSMPEELLMRSDERRVLDEALRQLTPEHRAVVELSYFHDCGCREIAQIVACPVDTVKTRLFYARRRLKLLLSARMEDLR